jgi:ribA/ribD-fused uncharacterized protein
MIKKTLDGKEHICFYIREEEHGFLSNLWRDKIFEKTKGGWKIYEANEHYYQSKRAKDPAMQEWIRIAPTAYAAMMAGRALREEKGEVIKNWEKKKEKIMLEGLRLKFKNDCLAKQLLDTGDLPLHECSPTDTFWGVVVSDDGYFFGQDMLGKLLMKVRDELRED